MKTQRTSRLPMLFTQPIGSLPRPQVVLDLLADREKMPAASVQPLMDEMVIFAIRLQERAGLDVVSDGEWRRVQYIREYLLRIGGFERVRKYEHQGETKYSDVVVRRIEFRDPVFVRDAVFLAAHTSRVTKFALPSPFLIAIRFWHERYSREAYPTLEHFIAHLAEALAAEARALVDAGIDIIQIDDPALTYFCDRDLMAGMGSHDERLRREWSAECELPLAIEAINQVTDGLRAEVQLHCCHSVYKRRSDVAGNYQPLMPYLAALRVDRVNLEFAYQNTGEVSDLALLPPHLNVGMGVIDVRSEIVPEPQRIEALIQAGAEMLDPSRIALNPDCGFAPDASEPPTIDEAYRKLRTMTEAAARVRDRLAVSRATPSV